MVCWSNDAFAKWIKTWFTNKAHAQLCPFLAPTRTHAQRPDEVGQWNVQASRWLVERFHSKFESAASLVLLMSVAAPTDKSLSRVANDSCLPPTRACISKLCVRVRQLIQTQRLPAYAPSCSLNHWRGAHLGSCVWPAVLISGVISAFIMSQTLASQTLDCASFISMSMNELSLCHSPANKKLTPRRLNASNPNLSRFSCKKASTTANARTPSATPKTPRHAFDRFIPNRCNMNLELNHYLVCISALRQSILV